MNATQTANMDAEKQEQEQHVKVHRGRIRWKQTSRSHAYEKIVVTLLIILLFTTVQLISFYMHCSGNDTKDDAAAQEKPGPRVWVESGLFHDPQSVIHISWMGEKNFTVDNVTPQSYRIRGNRAQVCVWFNKRVDSQSDNNMTTNGGAININGVDND